MYLSPFHLFIMLLLILLVATFARNWGLIEGFVTFNKDISSFTQIKVPAYDKTNNIIKLYDDIYYDHRNGNCVIITGTASTPALSTESEGKTVTAIDVYQRKGGASARYSTPATVSTSSTGAQSTTAFQQTTDESKISTIPSMIKDWTILTPEKNQLNYMSWGTNTFLSVFDLSNAELQPVAQVGTPGGTGYVAPVVPSYKLCIANSYTGSVTGVTKTYDIDIPMVQSSAYSYSDDATVDKDYVEETYDMSTNLYKVLKNVYYDVKNGNLLMNTSTTATAPSVNVYYRNHNGLLNAADVVLTSSLKTSTAPETVQPAKTASGQRFTTAASEPWFVRDPLYNNTIIYWPSGSSTIIAAFSNKFVTGSGIPLLKVRRFTNNGIYNDSSGSGDSGSKDQGSNNKKLDGSGNEIDDALLDAFSRWYIYFNTSAVGSGNSSDYLLKTQIVPPVCPACPACPNAGGSCTNCGGQGGSGTLHNGGSLADVKGPFSGIASLGQSAGSAIEGTAAAAGATAIGTASALGATALGTGLIAGNVVNNTVSTAGNLVGKTIDTAGNIVGGTVNAASNIVGGTVGTAGNIIQSAGSGVGNLLGLNNPNRFGYDQSYRGPNQSNVGSYGYVPQQSYMATSGTYNDGSNVDIYSRYGALPNKGSSNYRPITTDFSSFRK